MFAPYFSSFLCFYDLDLKVFLRICVVQKNTVEKVDHRQLSHSTLTSQFLYPYLPEFCTKTVTPLEL